ncbi:MAG: hypothetical protein H7834_04645 [Magnetococcus sp. YQC-9]
MARGRRVAVAGMILVGLTGEASALTISGPMTVKSALNDPFVAEIAYSLEPGEAPPGVEVLVGSQSDFASAGAARSRLKAHLVADGVPGDKGKRGGLIVIRGTQPEQEPFFTVLLRVTQDQVSFVRNYPIALDAAASGVSSAFPVKSGQAAEGEVLPAIQAIPTAQPSSSVSSWQSVRMAWYRLINGLSRETSAGFAGTLALLVLLVMRWSRRRREALDAEGAQPSGSRRHEPVAVEAPCVPETRSDEDSTPELAAFVVALDPAPEPGFTPDPMGEMPAAPPVEEVSAVAVAGAMEESAAPAVTAEVTAPALDESPVKQAPVKLVKRAEVAASQPERSAALQTPLAAEPLSAALVTALGAEIPDHERADAFAPMFEAAVSNPDGGSWENEPAAHGASVEAVVGASEGALSDNLGGGDDESSLDLSELLMALELAPETHPSELEELFVVPAEEESFVTGELETSGSDESFPDGLSSIGLVAEPSEVRASDEVPLESFSATGLDLIHEPAFVGEPDWGVVGDLEDLGEFESLDAEAWRAGEVVVPTEEELRTELDQATRSLWGGFSEAVKPGSAHESVSFGIGTSGAEIETSRVEVERVEVEAMAFEPVAVLDSHPNSDRGRDEIDVLPFEIGDFQVETPARSVLVEERETESASAWEFIPFEVDEGVKREFRVTR